MPEDPPTRAEIEEAIFHAYLVGRLDICDDLLDELNALAVPA